MMMRSLATGVVGCLLLASGCGLHQPGNSSNSDAPPVINVASDDSAMNAAIDHARATAGGFIKELQHPQKVDQTFTFKVKLTDPNVPNYGEHIWLSNVSYDGAKLHGTIAEGDEPQVVKTAKVGDRIAEDPKLISDWMYVQGGKLRGGYTVRVLYLKATPSDQADMRKETGFSDAEFKATD